MSSQMAYALFKVQLKIIRLRERYTDDPTWTKNYAKQYLPVDVVVTPEKEITEEILRHLLLPYALCVLPFFNNQLHVVSVLIEKSSDLTATPIKHLDKIFRPISTSIIKIVRGKIAFVPSDHDVLEVGDKLYFLTPAESLERLSANIGYPNASVKRLLIVGGGRTGLLLAETIEKKISTYYIDSNRVRKYQNKASCEPAK